MDKLTVTVLDRLLFEELIPEKTNFLDRTLSRNLREKIHFSSKEVETLQLEQDGDRLKWNTTKEEPLTIELEDSETSFLKRMVEKLDKEDNISDGIYELCKKIKEL